MHNQNNCNSTCRTPHNMYSSAFHSVSKAMSSSRPHTPTLASEHTPSSPSQVTDEHSSESSCDHVSVDDGTAGSCSCSEWGDHRPPQLEPPPVASTSGFLSPTRLLGSRPAPHQPEGVTAAPAPSFTVPMQSSLLKRIGAYRTKEELLDFVGSYLMFLDVINLVTCLYRFAKLSIGQRSRGAYLLELQRAPAFQLLLRTISSKFLQAQLAFLHRSQDIRGVDDARCLSNLVWSLVKLDLSSDAASLSNELALNVAPFVCRCLDDCSPQGLANMLWAYSKLSVTPPEVVAGLVDKIADKLSAPARVYGGSQFDAQALSNSIWALAHLKGRGMDLDAIGCNLVRFLEALAHSAAVLLGQRQHRRPDVGSVASCRAFLEGAESAFSCQALVNIAWSFATLIGTGCAAHAPVRHLFAAIHTESTARLIATSALLKAGQRLGPGGFNEQALSNAVFAFDKAGLLRRDLLEAIFAVATERLVHGERAGALSFKAQELCTLLKTCHSGIAEPWGFLTALLRVSTHYPGATASWAVAEQAELNRAFQLLLSHTAAQEWQQQRQQQEVLLLQQQRRQDQQLQQLLQQQQQQQQLQHLLQQQQQQAMLQAPSLHAVKRVPGHLWLQQQHQEMPALSGSAALAALGIPDLGAMSLDLNGGGPAVFRCALDFAPAPQPSLLLECSRPLQAQVLQSYQPVIMPQMHLHLQ